MTSGDPNIALKEKMTDILLKVPIESYRTFFYRVILTLLVFELQGDGYICPPHYGEVG